MSQIAVAVTSFIVHRLGPDPTTALVSKLHDVFTWGVYAGRPKQKGLFLLLFDELEEKRVM